jgi:hypothetical protein
MALDKWVPKLDFSAGIKYSFLEAGHQRGEKYFGQSGKA